MLIETSITDDSIFDDSDYGGDDDHNLNPT